VKKRLPLELLTKFNPPTTDWMEKIVSPIGEKPIITFKDKDPQSDFFFEINSHDPQRNSYLIRFKPISKNNIGTFEDLSNVEGVVAYFNAWTLRVEAYNNTESIFDDPIEKQFAEDFLNEFNFVTDPENDNKPFSIDVILKLDEHLEQIETKIGQYGTTDNAKQIQEIKLLSQTLRADLTTRPRGQIKTRVSILWAKIAKQGPKAIKEFLTEGGKILVKETVKFLLTEGLKYLSGGIPPTI
jgi:hypothetical protein